MTKQGYKFKHTETCNIRTQQIIYSCTEGHVMRFFFIKKRGVYVSSYILCSNAPLHSNVWNFFSFSHILNETHF